MTHVLSQPPEVVTPEIVNEYYHVIKGAEAPVDAHLFEIAASRFGINWLGLWAMSIVETGWFTSAILKEKRNLFGLGAVDRDPGEAASFLSLEEAAKAGAQHLAVYAGSPFVKDLAETAFVLPRTYQLLRWGWFGIVQTFVELGGKDKDGKIKWASNSDHGRQVENLISQVTQYALKAQPPPKPVELPKESLWIVILQGLKGIVPVVGKIFPPLALYSAAIYAVIDILIRIFGALLFILFLATIYSLNNWAI